MSSLAVSMPAVRSYDHVGIRVSDRTEALHFYGRLGFAMTVEYPEFCACELQSETGVVLNLVFNAVKRAGASNVLLDEVIKWPGTTHPCFLVDDLASLVEWLGHENIKITEGPLTLDRRMFLFIRDPDGNVIEFTQVLQTEVSNAPV